MKSCSSLAVFVLIASDGAFAQVPNYGEFVAVTEGAPATVVRPLDVNQDGVLDLVLAGGMPNEVLWIRATAPGQFAPPAILTTLPGIPTAPARARDIAFIDLGGTGSRDLVVTLDVGNRVLRFPRTGPASFGAPVTIWQATSPPNGMEVADVDGDGDEDLIVCGNFGSSGTWLFENAGGSLAGGPVRMGGGGRGVKSADFDLDGDIDFFAASSSGALYALRNAGSGGIFASITLGFSAASFDFAVGDLNGDGFIDVADSGSNGKVRTFLCDAAGNFSQGQSIFYGPVYPGALPIELIDLDGDSDLDVAVAPLNTSRVKWVENLGTDLDFRLYDLLPSAGVTGNFERADLDGDGALDLIAVGGSVVQVGLTAGAGPPQALVEVTRRWNSIKDALALDADGDGDLDVAVVSEWDGVGIAVNDGTGKLRFPEVIAGFGGPAGPRVRQVVAGDINGDGLVDLILRKYFGGVLYSRQLAGGGFAPPVALSMAGTSSSQTPRLQDVNQDGSLDIVVDQTSPHRIVVHLQTAAGTFPTPTDVVETLGRPISYEFRHMDGDGVVDLATYEERVGFRNAMFVYYGQATGGFEPRVEIPLLATGAQPNGNQLYEDLDGDGNVDVIYPQGQSIPDTIRWTRNLGGRQFAPPAVIGNIGTFVFRIALAESAPGGPKVLAVGSLAAGSLERYRLFGLTGANTLDASHWVSSLGVRASSMFFADLGTGAQDLVITDDPLDRLGVVYNHEWRDIGTGYCGPAPPNSTGVPGEITAFGSTDSTRNTLDLVATQLPSGATTLFLVSSDAGFLAAPNGSQGNLCLGGQIGRLNQPGLFGPATNDGVFRRRIDLTSVPQHNGTVAVLPVSTWRFQAWHRDFDTGQIPTSNFTDAVAVTFD